MPSEGEVVLPLQIETQTICQPEEAWANVRHALTLPHRFLKPKEVHRRTVSICGGGPSLKATTGELAGDVLACNTAIGWLYDQGITPDMAMMWDSDPRMIKFARRVPTCTYYLASRCDPAVFEQLFGMDIVIWHAAGDKDLAAKLEEWTTKKRQHSPLINGGSAAVTRAMYLAAVLGYRDMHLFGADSSFEGDVKTDTHVRPSIVEETEIKVRCNGRWFQTTGWLAAQAQEFEAIYTPLVNLGVTITVHGDGLIPHIWRTLSAQTQQAASVAAATPE
jgi:hypothetical protein